MKTIICIVTIIILGFTVYLISNHSEASLEHNHSEASLEQNYNKKYLEGHMEGTYYKRNKKRVRGDINNWNDPYDKGFIDGWYGKDISDKLFNGK